jgi:hypothetical protein
MSYYQVKSAVILLVVLVNGVLEGCGEDALLHSSHVAHQLMDVVAAGGDVAKNAAVAPLRIVGTVVST